ncbi:MAG: alpha/beta hydrolase [Turneriella sp.]|nr:alpha/beta hydrolase [Turneriella sp.]
MLPELSLWLSSGRYIDFKGRGIFVRESKPSRKETILLIHGFPTSSWDFLPIWQLLEKKYRLITFDMLGFGFSAKPQEHTYSIREQADIAELVLYATNTRKYHLLGHDYGVSVAQELLARQGALKKPALSVCFLNGGLYPEFHKPLLIQKLMLGPLGPLLARLSTKGKLRSSFAAIFGERKASEREVDIFWELICYNKGRLVIPKLLRYMTERRLYRERWVNAMEQTKIPVQLINGPLDPISGRHLAEAFALRNPKARVDSLEGVGHYPQVEAPERVAALYLDFLRQI